MAQWDRLELRASPPAEQVAEHPDGAQPVERSNDKPEEREAGGGRKKRGTRGRSTRYSRGSAPGTAEAALALEFAIAGRWKEVTEGNYKDNEYQVEKRGDGHYNVRICDVAMEQSSQAQLMKVVSVDSSNSTAKLSWNRRSLFDYFGTVRIAGDSHLKWFKRRANGTVKLTFSWIKIL